MTTQAWPFEDWIHEARAYSKLHYGSDVELGDDEDMRDFYTDGYDHESAVDEVFADGVI
jgi:hypothetical protein